MFWRSQPSMQKLFETMLEREIMICNRCLMSMKKKLDALGRAYYFCEHCGKTWPFPWWKRMVKCESCGKNGLDKENDFCYGCGHIICNDCCFDEEDDLIAGEHSLSTHKRALKKKSGKWWFGGFAVTRNAKNDSIVLMPYVPIAQHQKRRWFKRNRFGDFEVNTMRERNFKVIDNKGTIMFLGLANDSAEELLHSCREELKRIESNLRVKGDFWRAEKVKRFRIEYFGEEQKDWNMHIIPHKCYHCKKQIWIWQKGHRSPDGILWFHDKCAEAETQWMFSVISSATDAPTSTETEANMAYALCPTATV